MSFKVRKYHVNQRRITGYLVWWPSPSFPAAFGARSLDRRQTQEFQVHHDHPWVLLVRLVPCFIQIRNVVSRALTLLKSNQLQYKLDTLTGGPGSPGSPRSPFGPWIGGKIQPLAASSVPTLRVFLPFSSLSNLRITSCICDCNSAMASALSFPLVVGSKSFNATANNKAKATPNLAPAIILTFASEFWQFWICKFFSPSCISNQVKTAQVSSSVLQCCRVKTDCG